jgi:hypothetical protein
MCCSALGGTDVPSVEFTYQGSRHVDTLDQKRKRGSLAQSPNQKIQLTLRSRHRESSTPLLAGNA